MCGVSHDSVLGPFFFKYIINLNDLFLFLNEIDVCNVDSTTTPFSMSHKKLAELLEKL